MGGVAGDAGRGSRRNLRYNARPKRAPTGISSVDVTSAGQERCTEGHLWFSGYISQRYIDSRNPAGLRNGIFGLPANYHPAQQPVVPWPVGGQIADRNSADYDTNYFYVPLKNGNIQRVLYGTGLHPWRNQYRLGPFNYITDASLLKFFNVTEPAKIVFNQQGLNTHGSDGIVSLAYSYGGNGFRPRRLQLTMRVEW